MENITPNTENIEIEPLQWFPITENGLRVLEGYNSEWISLGRVPPFGLKKETAPNKARFSEGYSGIISIDNSIITCKVSKEPLTIIDYVKMWLYTIGSHSDLILELDTLGGTIRSLSMDIFKLFLKEVEDVCGLGVIADYEQIGEYRPFVIGEIDIIKTVLSSNAEIYSYFHILEFETALNRFISSVLRKIDRHVSHDKQMSRQTRNIFRLFEFIPPYNHPLIQIPLEPTLRDPPILYRKIIDLGRLILEELAPGALGVGEGYIPPVIINVDEIFERFIQLILTQNLPQTVSLPTSQQTYGRAFRGETMWDEKSYIPDLLVKRGQEIIGIIDVKNKPRDIFNNQDVFQMVAYCTFTKSRYAVLIHPDKGINTVEKIVMLGKIGIPTTIYGIRFCVPSENSNWESEMNNLVNLVRKIIESELEMI